MNLSLRRLTDIVRSLAWARAAWGIAALLVMAYIVGIAASAMNEPPLQVGSLGATVPPAVHRLPSHGDPALTEEDRALDGLRAPGG